MKRSDTGRTTTTRRLLDEYLVVAAQGGDRRAFSDLVRRWQPRLVAHAWRLLGDGEAARDCVQAAWLEITRGLTGLQDERAFPAWAYRIVSRRCARDIASSRQRRNISRAAAAEPEPAPGQTDFEGRDDARRLHGAIRDLPPAQRAAVALFHFEGLGIAEIAVALDVPAGTIKTRLMHARRALRAVLEGDHNDPIG
jgi:RNA polymerase sigma-70 factor (ECF subfamily)